LSRLVFNGKLFEKRTTLTENLTYTGLITEAPRQGNLTNNFTNA
jgi:hypothetical protein